MKRVAKVLAIASLIAALVFSSLAIYFFVRLGTLVTKHPG